MGDLLLIGSCNSMLRALDRGSGLVVWETKTCQDGPASFHGDPLVVEELFFIGTDGPKDEGIHALDWSTGVLRWTSPVPARDFGAVGVATDIQFSEGRIYAIKH